MRISDLVRDQVSDLLEGATGRQSLLPIPLSDRKNVLGESVSSPLGLALFLRSR